MSFAEWLVALDRELMRRFRIDHILGGFDDDELVADWKRGESPEGWALRIGVKYGLDEYDADGAIGWRAI